MAIWGVIPAAGYGTRMSAPLPKQYLDMHGETLLQRSCYTLLNNQAIDGVVVVLAPDDTGFQELPDSIQSRVFTTVGGATRSDSVAAGVKKVISEAGEQSWALVHDAARPLLSQRDLLNLISEVTRLAVGGGLLATPVNDTLKRACEGVGVDTTNNTNTTNTTNTTDSSDEVSVSANGATVHVGKVQHNVVQTVDREKLWQAQTPQMFRAKALLTALTQAADAGVAVTDEASAMEYMGMNPLLVPAMDPNFKVTRDADLQLANAYLALQRA